MNIQANHDQDKYLIESDGPQMPCLIRGLITLPVALFVTIMFMMFLRFVAIQQLMLLNLPVLWNRIIVWTSVMFTFVTTLFAVSMMLNFIGGHYEIKELEEE